MTLRQKVIGAIDEAGIRPYVYSVFVKRKRRLSWMPSFFGDKFVGAVLDVEEPNIVVLKARDDPDFPRYVAEYSFRALRNRDQS